ncbi:FIST C-terminal domain-containing protein [Flammeovirga yaeyamensis]|uniref:FIST C-terminal domain-containing protein n=1 Tax=Flammeovirga yaeyamensis TaxID=367791 RepID=A0AAX1N7E0_9BACT|nr:FIST C-terminal domain-containing protein [Flammeovirga yaeyamensis]MBB3697974.1 hypothetical protein [Flammeovirga yaeyamensis]NMF35674.1 hypothetical protein [Flammeovirga yaeyamensis]QWG03372.1 FIST C-terminal domain-containing protein [Flammeovirga yaeyamensis]
MFYLFDNYIDPLKSLIQEFDINETVFLFLVAENNKEEIPTLIDECNKINIKFFGGFFPKIIHGNKALDEGFICHPISSKNSPVFISKEKLFHSQSFSHKDEQNIYLLIDGLSSNSQRIIENIYEQLGSDYQIFGGGTGSLSLNQHLSVFDNHGIYKDCAIICSTNNEFTIDVKHGWNRLYGPLVATKTDKNWIYELNWQNAFEVYQGIIGKEIIDKDDFFSGAKNHPFGLSKEGYEDIIRDPILINEQGAIKCVGEILENTIVYIMGAEKTDLIQAANIAAQNVTVSKKPSQLFLVDCISRLLFLEDEYEKELEVCSAQHETSPNTIGVLSLGEISSLSKNKMVEYLNKTIVVNAIEK